LWEEGGGAGKSRSACVFVRKGEPGAGDWVALSLVADK
jgi:hypothetical protein